MPLVVNVKYGTPITIGDGIKVIAYRKTGPDGKFQNNQVKMVIEAPKEIKIMRRPDLRVEDEKAR